MFPSNILHILAYDQDDYDAYVYNYSNTPSWGDMFWGISLMIGFIYAFYYARKFIYEWQLENKRKLKEQEPRVCRDENSEVIDDEVKKQVKGGQEAVKKTKPVQQGKESGDQVVDKTGTPVQKHIARAREELERNIKRNIKRLDSDKSKLDTKKIARLLCINGFDLKQYMKLNDLKNDLLDTMAGLSKESKNPDSDIWDNYSDKDFALSLLSGEKDALHELEEAIKRLENGKYGICELSGEKIPESRLEAIPFTRYTTQSKIKIEKETKN